MAHPFKTLFGSIFSKNRPRLAVEPKRRLLRVETLEDRRLLTLSATTLSLTPPATTLTYGQTVTLTAAVAPVAPSTLIPSEGTVTFMEGTTSLGTASVGAGTATLSNVLLPVGSDVITAAYSDTGGSFASSSTTVAPNSVITTIAGNGTASYSGDNGPATAAELAEPARVALDAAGDIFIADYDNNRVREINHATGVITTVAGNGTQGYSGDNGPATAAELNGPVGVALDAAGDLFIGEIGNDRVREVNAATGVITTVAGNGAEGYSGDNGPATAAELQSFIGIAVDAAGDIFLADRQNCAVREVNHLTGIITTVAGTGHDDYSGDNGPATAADINEPYGVAVDVAGDIFIADAGNNRIREVNHATGVITTVAGNGTQGYSGDNGPANAAQLNGPTDVAVNAGGDLFIVDSGNQRVREVNAATGMITTDAGNGDAGYGGDNGPATAAQLNNPYGIALDTGGNLFIADIQNNRVREVASGAASVTVSPSSTTTIVTASATSLTYGQTVNLTATVASVAPGTLTPSEGIVTFMSGTNVLGSALVNAGTAVLTGVLLPAGASVISASYTDSAGNFVAGIQTVGPTSIITTAAGNGTFGYNNDNDPATAAELYYPQGVAIDAVGDIFIADTDDDRIEEINHSTGLITTVAGNGTAGYRGDNGPATAAGLSGPEGVAVDAAGDIFIADFSNNRIREVNHATGVITTVAGNGTAGYSGDNGPATAAGLKYPSDVAVDAAGDLFIADTYDNRIREVNHSTGVITTVAGNGYTSSDGEGGYSGDTGQATAAELNFPSGVAVNAAGDIFIADSFNNRIREVNHANGVITTVAGNGAEGYSGDNGPAAAAELSYPHGVAIDAAGDLFIADSSNARIREVSHATGVITTVAGNGTGGYSGDNGPAAAAELYYPGGVAVDAVGDLFIGDTNNQRIREVNHANGVITTVAGGTIAYSGDAGLATAAQLYQPGGVAVDAAGDIFIADTYNQRIREVNHATGVITTVAGNGTQGYSGDNGPATAAELNNPASVAIDAAGDIFIADFSNNRIREVNHATGVNTTVAGNGTAGYSGDIGPAPAAELFGPAGVAVDAAGNLFIADSYNNRIREVNHATGVISTVAGSGAQGYRGDNGPATAAGLSGPEGVAVDATGDLFIADTHNGRIREVSHATGVISTVAGSGAQGYGGDNGPATSAELEGPTGVALDSAGDLFISDVLQSGNRASLIREVNLATGVITTVAGSSFGSYGGDTGLATAARLNFPSGVAVDTAGDLFIADTYNRRIREITGTGRATTVTVSPSATTTTVTASAATLIYGQTVNLTATVVPVAPGTLVPGEGTVVFLDRGQVIGSAAVSAGTATISGVLLPMGTDQITAVYSDAAGGNFTGSMTTIGPNARIATVAGNGTAGYSGDNGVATAAELNNPSGVAVDVAGDIFIADSFNQRIREVNAGTGVITTVAGNGTGGYSGDNGPATAAQIFYPNGVAVDAAGNLFIADYTNSRIRMVNAGTGVITTVAGDGTNGYSGDNGQATAAELSNPTNLAVDSHGDLFIADYNNSRIREVNQSTSVITTVAGNGTAGYSGDNGPATAAGLKYPYDVALDAAGDLFIADLYNHRIREVNAATGMITTVAGNGIGGYNGDGGPATAAELYYPQSVVVDSAGDLFIDDSSNNRIREVNAATGVITTVAGNGTQGYSGGNGLATAAELNNPASVAIDAAGDIFIADFSNNRIREVFSGTTVTVGALPAVLLNPPSAGNTSVWAGTSVSIANSGATITDAESGTLASLTVAITTSGSPHAGDVLTDSTAGTSITSSYNSGAGILTLSGADTLAHYQQVLRSIAYNNTLGSPGIASESLSVVANDGTYSSTAAVATITINVPVLSLNPPAANYTSTWVNGGPVSIANSAATIVDGESGNLHSMNTTLTSVHTGDVLAANVVGTSIASAYNSSSGLLTLTGTDTLAHYQQVLRTITYNNTHGGPLVVSETINVVANDGTHTSAIAVATINMPPALLLNSPALNYGSTWAGFGVSIASSTATITDGGSGNLVSLTAALASVHGGDVLMGSTVGTSISSSYNAGTGVLTLSGSDTLTHYQQVLRSITYNNTTGGPGVGSESVSVVASDGSNSSAGALATISIKRPPVLLLNNPNANYTSTWTNGGPLPIANSNASITDPESGTLTSLTAVLTSLHAGDVLADNTSGTSISSSYNAGTGVLTLSGTDTLANYQQVLRSITYDNSNGGPDVGSETVTVVANDGTNNSSAAVGTINVYAAPVVLLIPSSSTWTNGGPVAIGSTSTITDGESASLTSLTATLTTHQPSDVLTDTTVAGISSTYNTTLGVLTLSGNSTVAKYQTVLQSIRYNNTAGGPGIGSETVSVLANDGTNSSSAVVGTININVVPVVLLTPSSSTWINGGPVTIGNLSTITDGETGNLTSLAVSLTTIGSPHTGDALVGNIAGTSITSSYNAGTGVLILSGSDTLAHYQQVLRSVTYNNTVGGPGIGAETVSVVANDGTNSSTAVTDTLSISVAPVVLLNNPAAIYTSTWTNAGPVPIASPTATVTDGESPTLASLTVAIVGHRTGDILADNTSGTSISSTYNSGTGVLTLIGVDTSAHYQQVLESVTYNNTAGSPGVASEILDVYGSDGILTSSTAVATINIIVPSTVTGVNLFYDNSKFNKNIEGVGTTDDKAIDASKTAYLPGAGTANFSNISAYTDGINGIMIDLAGRATHTAITASDFTFKMGLNNTPSTWAAAANPSTVSVRIGAGLGGGDRVELTWTDGSITQEWLEVTVNADANTGLATPYTFFYGSVMANSGTGDTGAFAHH